jgi:hypothetical protein
LSTPSNLSHDRRRYLTIGRAAARAWLAREAGDPSTTAACGLLREGRVAAKVVRFWLLEDLLPDLRLEAAARTGYPELEGLCDELLEERRAACRRAIAASVAETLAS